MYNVLFKVEDGRKVVGYIVKNSVNNSAGYLTIEQMRVEAGRGNVAGVECRRVGNKLFLYTVYNTTLNSMLKAKQYGTLFSTLGH